MNEYDVKRYVINNMQTDGTEIFIINLHNPNSSSKVFEMISTPTDIVLNPESFELFEVPYKQKSFETCLSSYA